MSIVRRVIAVGIVAAGAYALWLFCVLPYRCNLIKKVRTGATESAYDNLGSPDGRIAARRNVDALLHCMRPACRDVSLDMLTAANYRILGQYETAADLYRHALLLDQRPEIYLNLGATELAAGDRDSARRHMLRAALFNVYMVSHIEDGLLRQEIVKKLIELRPENADFIRYADSLSAPM